MIVMTLVENLPKAFHLERHLQMAVYWTIAIIYKHRHDIFTSPDLG